MAQEHDAPYFRGWLVREITAEDDGLALWLWDEGRSGVSRLAFADGADELRRRADGAARDELKDALAACREWRGEA